MYEEPYMPDVFDDSPSESSKLDTSKSESDMLLQKRSSDSQNENAEDIAETTLDFSPVRDSEVVSDNFYNTLESGSVHDDM